MSKLPAIKNVKPQDKNFSFFDCEKDYNLMNRVKNQARLEPIWNQFNFHPNKENPIIKTVTKL